MAWDTGDIPQFRKRRNIRGPVTLVLLIGLLGGAAWYGWTSVLGSNDPAAVVKVCTTPSAGAGKQLIAAKDVVINVYNAGKVKGAAARTGDQLEARGFRVEDISDDDSNVPRVELRGRAVNAPEVLLVLAQVNPTDKPVVKADGRQDPTVDFVIGNEFSGLKAKAPKQLQVKSPVPVCTSASPSPPVAGS